MFDRISAATLPGSCLLCGDTSRNALLCRACAAELPPAPANACPICADGTTHGERCGACLNDRPAFDRVSALFTYVFPVDRLIQALKYGHQLGIARWFGEHLVGLLTEPGIDAIVPMPLHVDRLRERGFNQSAEIAKAFGIRAKIPVDRNSLRRTRATAAQAELALDQRHRNVRGAFECDTDFTGQRVILIDDVLTSGASASECARVLKLHGASTVHVMVVARALKH